MLSSFFLNSSIVTCSTHTYLRYYVIVNSGLEPVAFKVFSVWHVLKYFTRIYLSDLSHFYGYLHSFSIGNVLLAACSFSEQNGISSNSWHFVLFLFIFCSIAFLWNSLILNYWWKCLILPNKFLLDRDITCPEYLWNIFLEICHFFLELTAFSRTCTRIFYVLSDPIWRRKSSIRQGKSACNVYHYSLKNHICAVIFSIFVLKAYYIG
jgi:hypothetical protein